VRRTVIRWALGRNNSRLFFLTLVLITTPAIEGRAQGFTNASLNGKYFFVQLLVTADAKTGLPLTVSNGGGAIIFSGGVFTYSGSIGTNSTAAAAVSGSGTYSVSSDGTVVLSNLIRSDLNINGRLSADQQVIVGSTTENSKDNTGDLLVAIKAPSGGMSNASLNGTFNGSTMALPNGTIQSLSSSLFSIQANGAGQFTSGSVTGHRADQFNTNAAQTLSGVTYSINADGTGTIGFGSGTASSLLSGNRSIFVSSDGNYILGFSTDPGARDIFLATKKFSSAASNANLNGRYWIAELDFDAFQHQLTSGSGAFVVAVNQAHLLSERLNGGFNFSSLYYSAVAANSLGQFSRFPEAGLINMALGAPLNTSNTGVPGAMVGAQIDLPGFATTYYGVFFAVLAPIFTGSGGSVFLNPNGVVSGASFAPSPNAIAPGDIVSLFGSGLSAGTDQASTIPLPTSDQGVSVTVNGIAAPLFYISPGQINLQVPFEAAGAATAKLQVINNGQQSNTVTVALSPSNAGIFMFADSADPRHAAVLHANGTLVTSSNAATRGETIEVFATGLGVLNPAVATGAANPRSPVAASPDKFVNVLFDGEPAAGVPFAGGAPTFVGLNQINVVIPVDATTGSAVPIQIESSWGFSNVANIPIQLQQQ
jgi:uncharacterized protein (TIGR03437 family)